MMKIMFLIFMTPFMQIVDLFEIFGKALVNCGLFLVGLPEKWHHAHDFTLPTKQNIKNYSNLDVEDLHIQMLDFMLDEHKKNYISKQ